MKQKFSTVCWVIVRFLRQGFASVLVSAGDIDNQLRALLLMSLLVAYFALLIINGPYEKYFTNYDGTHFNKRKPSGARYKHIETVLILGQTFTIVCQLASEMNVKGGLTFSTSVSDGDIRQFLSTFAIVTNVFVGLFLAYNGVCDKFYEFKMRKDRRRLARSLLVLLLTKDAQERVQTSLQQREQSEQAGPVGEWQKELAGIEMTSTHSLQDLTVGEGNHFPDAPQAPADESDDEERSDRGGRSALFST